MFLVSNLVVKNCISNISEFWRNLQVTLRNRNNNYDTLLQSQLINNTQFQTSIHSGDLGRHMRCKENFILEKVILNIAICFQEVHL